VRTRRRAKTRLSTIVYRDMGGDDFVVSRSERAAEDRGWNVVAL
jgi:hypothetical protein